MNACNACYLQKSLTRIPVKEVEFGAMQYNHGNEKTLCNESKVVESKKTDDEFKKNNDLNTVIESPENIINIPPVPKTAVQFVMNWKANKSSEFRYQYLKVRIMRFSNLSASNMFVLIQLKA